MKDSFTYLNEVLRAYRTSEVIFTAYRLRLLNRLAEHPASIQTLSAELALSERGLKPLLFALQSLGLISRAEEHYMLIKDFEPFFNQNSDQFIGPLLDHEMHIRNRWQQLGDSVTKGRAARKENGKRSEAETSRFIRAMEYTAQRSAHLLIDVVPFRGDEHVLDLGGGPGKYMQIFCERFPQMHVTLFDQEESIFYAKKKLQHQPASKRMSFISGDVFSDDIGTSYDVILVSNLIHIFGDEQNLNLFEKCYDALKAEGRFLIKDFIMDVKRSPELFSSLFYLHMLLSTDHGKCYNSEEIFQLLSDSKFDKGSVFKLSPSSYVFEGIKSQQAGD